MAKYFKQEMNVLPLSGEKKCFYKLEYAGNISSKDLVEHIAYPGSGLSKGSVAHVLQTMIYEISTFLGKGYSVNIEGLGNFRATLGVRKDKEMDTIDGNEQKRNALSIVIDGVNFRPDKQFIIESNHHCNLKRGKSNKLHKSPYTKEERLQLALSYLSNPSTPFFRQADYEAMTKLSKFKAHEELVEFRNNPESGITHSGRGNNIIYIRNTK